MIKYLKYMFVVAIVMIAATGCQEDWEDTFSKEPTAPELVNNGMILMTKEYYVRVYYMGMVCCPFHAG